MAKLAPDGAEDLIVLRQGFHLMPEAAIPKRSEPRLFRKDAIFKTSDFLFPEAELICDCSDEIADLDRSGLGRVKSYEKSAVV